MYQAITSGAFRGLDSFLVQVEVDISDGLPCMDMIGYLANEVKESKERVRVGLKNSGFFLPIKRITISLTPADIRKDGSGFDLPVAIGILCAAGDLNMDEAGEEAVAAFAKKTVVIGELGLDGEVKPVKGVLPILLTAEKNGIENCILPAENMREAENVKTIRLFPVTTLKQAAALFESAGMAGYPADLDVRADEKAGTAGNGAENDTGGNEEAVDFSQICGQEQAKRAAEIAAAGFHNLLLFGPPGSGKSMIAERIPSILPKMTYEECLEVTQIYSVAGLLDPKKGLVTERPYERPHHTITPTALTGGGAYPLPGAITLAHKGVLFLDELPEFGREKLDLLRQPLEEKKIRIIRTQYACDYNCDFMFVAAMNPCPCGYYPDRRKCNCKDNEIRRYLKSVSGPILDRMDISVEVGKVEWAVLTGSGGGESSAKIRERVERAHQLQMERQGKYNASLSGDELDLYAKSDREAESLLAAVFERKQLSIRSYQRIRKLARTIADLKGQKAIGRDEMGEAILMNQGMDSIRIG